MKVFYKFGIALATFALASSSATGAELAILSNGFAIRHERREARATMTRLYLTAAPNNYVDVPAEDIVRFEKLEMPAPPAPVESPAPVNNLGAVIDVASNRNNVDPDLVISVIQAESGFNPRAVSRKGAQGLMQLMPQTAVQLGVKNPLDPAANVEGGTRYLKELLELYDNNLVDALAAYNAGPQSVAQYHGVPPYPETRTYIARVLSDFGRKKLSQQERSKKQEATRNTENTNDRARSSKVRPSEESKAPHE